MIALLTTGYTSITALAILFIVLGAYGYHQTRSQPIKSVRQWSDEIQQTDTLDFHDDIDEIEKNLNQ